MAGGDVLMLVDESGRVLEWRRPAEERYGWSAEEAVGRPVAALMHEVAAGDAWRRERFSDLSPVLVKPVLQDASVGWEVFAAADTATGQDVAILRAMFTQSPVGLHVLDDQLRVVRMNTATRALHDRPVGHLIGRHFTDVYGLENAEEEARAREVLETGEAVVNRLVRGVHGQGRPRRRAYSVSLIRLENARGDVLGLVASAVDVTERESARRRLAVLDVVRTQVGQRLDVIAVCEELVDAVVPAFSGIAVVEVIEDVVRGEEPPPAPVHRDVLLRRAAFRGRMSAHPVGDVRRLPHGTPFSRVLSDLRPRLVSVEEDSLWLAADPARAEAIRRSGAHSLIAVPLSLRGAALGVVSFYRHESEDPFGDEEVALASDVCAHAALCIDNARRYTRERTIAATVQRRLLPQRAGVRTTVDVSPLHLPGLEGGGAWFDVIALPGARTALIVGDVAGRGMAAATTMGQLRTVIHSLAALDLQPDELLARLNDTAVLLAAERAALPPGDPLHREPLSADCLIAVYDPVELTCTIARAGLAEPVAVFPDGSSATLSVPSGPLRPLLDRGRGQSVAELCDTIVYAMRDRDPAHETVMLLTRTKALPEDRVLTVPLPMDPEAAPIARAEVRRRLESWGTDEETAFTTELIVSELVGNAVRYGAPPLRLRLICDRMLTCEVSDAATSAPRVQHARTVDETGRGLFIIATLATQWGTRYHPQGKTIWAELPAEASPQGVLPVMSPGAVPR
ncbi:PAS domain-containing protein [Streptomyces sp. NPDC007264]|uniref:PAS domain-containing protein n=1 Tax=Streptomyces sp. NPDC007264 TaxID=3364777 RepID=UPI0036DA42FB